MRTQKNCRYLKFVGACALLAAFLSAPAGAQTSSFTGTYKGGSNSSCSNTYNISGKEPSASGTYPVFVWMVGTGSTYTNSTAIAAVDEMAARNHVAATIQYDNSGFNCPSLKARAQCAFDPAKATSAIRTLCSRAKADCSKGIVVAGYSQGALVTTLARNYDSRVAAAYGLGEGVDYTGNNVRSCILPANRLLPADRLRVANGEADDFVGLFESGVRSQLQELTGLSCGSTATSCFRGNGSGWYIVQHNEVEDGSADHCYATNGGCYFGSGVMDNGWRNGAAPWSLKPSLDWLKTFTTP